MSISLRKKAWYSDFVHKGQRYTGSVGPVSRTAAKEELARKNARGSTRANRRNRFARFARGLLPRILAESMAVKVTQHTSAWGGWNDRSRKGQQGRKQAASSVKMANKCPPLVTYWSLRIKGESLATVNKRKSP